MPHLNRSRRKANIARRNATQTVANPPRVKPTYPPVTYRTHVSERTGPTDWPYSHAVLKPARGCKCWTYCGGGW